MERIHTKHSIIVDTYEQYKKLFNSLADWNTALDNGDWKLNDVNSANYEETRHEKNRIFLVGNMDEVITKTFHMQLTLSIVKDLVKGLILCAEDFDSVLKGYTVFDLNTYNNCAPSSIDELLFEDCYCLEDSNYSGLIKTRSEEIVDLDANIRTNLTSISEELSSLQIMDVDVSGDIEVVNDCATKQDRVSDLYDFLVMYAQGVKNLNNYVHDNLSEYVTEEGMRQHPRPYIYSGEEGPIDETIESALLGLPFDIDMENISYTDDGYVLVKDSLGELLSKKYPGQDWSAYNDYYITGLNVDGEVSFSIVRVPVGSTVTVPFKDFDMAALEDVMNSSNDPNAVMTKVHDLVDTTMNSKDNSLMSDNLTNYYAQSQSKGNYLIANLVVEKSLESQKDNVKNGYYQLNSSYDKQDSNCKAKLDQLEKMGIYDRETNTITFDPNAISNEAYNAILMDTTGSPDTFAYAAENDFHADGQQLADVYIDVGTVNHDLNYAIGATLQEHTFESDAGVGESSLGFLYEGTFKDTDDGSLYEEQVENFG